MNVGCRSRSTPVESWLISPLPQLSFIQSDRGTTDTIQLKRAASDLQCNINCSVSAGNVQGLEQGEGFCCNQITMSLFSSPCHTVPCYHAPKVNVTSLPSASRVSGSSAARPRPCRHRQQQTSAPIGFRPSILATRLSASADEDAAASQDSLTWPQEVQPGDFAANTSSSFGSFSSVLGSSSSPPPPWAARMPTWNASTRKHLHHMMDLFTLADRVGV